MPGFFTFLIPDFNGAYLYVYGAGLGRGMKNEHGIFDLYRTHSM